MSRQAIGVTKTVTDIAATAPAGAVGLQIGFIGQLKPSKYLLTVTIGVAVDDVFLWGQTRDSDTDDTDDHVNGTWGLHNDKHGRYLDGKLAVGAAKLAVGVHHFVVEDIGGYVAVALQNTGAGGSTCTATLSEFPEKGGRA